jgi:hypothetical protein
MVQVIHPLTATPPTFLVLVWHGIVRLRILTPEEKQELERLVDTEWQAARERGAAILKQTPR